MILDKLHFNWLRERISFGSFGWQGSCIKRGKVPRVFFGNFTKFLASKHVFFRHLLQYENILTTCFWFRQCIFYFSTFHCTISIWYFVIFNFAFSLIILSISFKFIFHRKISLLNSFMVLSNIFFFFLSGISYQMISNGHDTKIKDKQELQEVVKFPIEIFWNIGARNFEIRFFFIFWNSLDYGNLNKKQNYRIGFYDIKSGFRISF